MLSVTEEYMAKNYEAFYKTMTKKRWNIYYEKNILSCMYKYKTTKFIYLLN